MILSKIWVSLMMSHGMPPGSNLLTGANQLFGT